MDNDYTRCAERCQEAIVAVESIDGVDPDIQNIVDQAAYDLNRAQTLATEREAGGGE